MLHSLTIRIVTLVCLVAACGIATAQRVEELPEEMQGIGVDEKRGDQIPLDLEFRDHNGQHIKLQDIFKGERPVLLSLNYSDCPMLCRQQLTALIQSMKEIEWTAGNEFEVVSVSINPNERPEQANLTHKLYVQQYERVGSADGLTFLVGDQKNIAALADAVGFRYKYIPDSKDYSHIPALMVMTPDGTVSRYLYGVMYDPKTLRLSMVEAGDGKIGSAMDQIFLACFQYDHTKGKYGPHAQRLMKLGAAVTVLVLGLSLIPFWLRRRRYLATDTADEATTTMPSPPTE